MSKSHGGADTGEHFLAVPDGTLVRRSVGLHGLSAQVKGAQAPEHRRRTRCLAVLVPELHAKRRATRVIDHCVCGGDDAVGVICFGVHCMRHVSHRTSVVATGRKAIRWAGCAVLPFACDMFVRAFRV